MNCKFGCIYFCHLLHLNIFATQRTCDKMASIEKRSCLGTEYGYKENDINIIYDDCPCRWNQIDSLLKLIGPRDELCPQSLFIYGHTATGKSHLLRCMVNTLKVKPFSICVWFYRKEDYDMSPPPSTHTNTHTL